MQQKKISEQIMTLYEVVVDLCSVTFESENRQLNPHSETRNIFAFM